jgi:hypothetical protein
MSWFRKRFKPRVLYKPSDYAPKPPKPQPTVCITSPEWETYPSGTTLGPGFYFCGKELRKHFRMPKRVKRLKFQFYDERTEGSVKVYWDKEPGFVCINGARIELEVETYVNLVDLLGKIRTGDAAWYVECITE